MVKILERHRVPLGSQYTLIYHRCAERVPLEVTCAFRLGYADGQPGEVYTLFKAFQTQYSSAWRPRLSLTPDWAMLHFIASSEQRRELDQHWLQLFELSAALTPLEPLRQGLLQEQRWHQEALPHALQQRFQQLAFSHSAYDRPPLGSADKLLNWDQEDLMQTYEQLFTPAPVYLRICDSQPLHQVLERLKPLLQRKQHHSTQPEGLLQQTALRELHLPLATEGAWLYFGLVVPGRDHPHWLYGPLLRAWLAQAWEDQAASPQLHCLSSRWLPWQRGALVQFCLHSHQAQELATHKQAVVEWLASLRQHYLTPRRLKAALNHVIQESQTQEPPLFMIIDEMLSGWGHGRQRLQQISLERFQQQLDLYFNAEHLVLLSACSAQMPLRQLPDYRKVLPKMGFAPVTKSTQQTGYYPDIQHLHLGPEHKAWLVPQSSAELLHIGLWFAHGAVHDAIPGSSWAVLQRLRQHWLQHAQRRGKGAWKPELSWQAEVQAEASFITWQVIPQEWPHALLLLQDLLHDISWPQTEWEAFRQHAQTQLHANYLRPEHKAHEQFMASGFPNHPYALPLTGNALSQRQWSPLILQSHWQTLRQQQVQPILLGRIPKSLSADALQVALQNLAWADNSPGTLPPVRTRRGEIALKTMQLDGFRMEGQVFNQPLLLEQMLPLQLAAQWLEDRTRTQHGLPLSHAFSFFRQAWAFRFWGLYTKPERTTWLNLSFEPDASLQGLKPRFLAERRLRLQRTLWSELVHWLSLDGSASAFFEQEHRLISLPQEALAEQLRSFQHTQDWLQIIFQAAEKK